MMNLHKNKIYRLFCLLTLGVAFASCEYFTAPEETLNVQTGEILFPSITLNGAQYITFESGSVSDYEDPGVVATLGSEDVSEQVEITGSVDASTPGVYVLVYSVSTTNSLGQESAASASRFVNVTSQDVTATDLSGTYLGTGFSSAPTPKVITQIAPGWYSVPDVLGSGNGIVATFAHNGGDNLIIPDQTGGFGNVNTLNDGTYATLIPGGFEWVVFIGCCGNFGPITWIKQ